MRITKKQIEKAVSKCFVGEVVSFKQFAKGNINTILEIKLKKTHPLLLKLYDEAWKAKKENYIYQLIRDNTDVPVPRVHCLDDSGKILPNAYLLMTKIEGKKITDNEKLYKKAGEISAKIHSIKFNSFGWILGDKIQPKFKTWRGFADYDIKRKVRNICKVGKLKGWEKSIMKKIEEKDYLFNIKGKPSLLHKDFHPSHILVKKDKISGIIDTEWSIAGHGENDFTKLEQWVFPAKPKLRKSFFAGYQRYGTISKEYEERKYLYNLWNCISMINISLELDKKSWFNHNVKQLCFHIE